MAKVTTEKITKDRGLETELSFSYDVNVDKAGLFSTTLPIKIVTLFEEAGVQLSTNRLGHHGYISSSTLDGLNEEVNRITSEYMSRELVSEKVILRYSIETNCHYVLDKDGNIAPNGCYSPLEGAGWISGTINNLGSMTSRPYLFQVGCEPMMRRDYLYKSGTIRTEYERLSHRQVDGEKRPALLFLTEIVRMNLGSKVQEIDYDELTAAFFVRLIKSICQINQTIKDFLDPASIKMIAEQGGNLLPQHSK